MKPRRNASMENAKCYAPQILVGTEGLPREQWLEYRRKGIGGSDAAAVLGISPFRTGRDLYYDKLNIVTADDAENWVQLEVGTLLEPLVAKIFAHKTGYKIYRRPFMFRHPQYRVLCRRYRTPARSAPGAAFPPPVRCRLRCSLVSFDTVWQCPRSCSL